VGSTDEGWKEVGSKDAPMDPNSVEPASAPKDPKSLAPAPNDPDSAKDSPKDSATESPEVEPKDPNEPRGPGSSQRSSGADRGWGTLADDGSGSGAEGSRA
jgi:hypothetical protein